MPISKKEVSAILNLEIPDWVDSGDREDILKEVGDFVINEVISYTESGVSAVDGDEFPKLSPKYANAEKGGDRVANLDLTGDMLAALTYEVVGGTKIKIGIFEEDQAIKAYNHNVGDTLPKRQFIPDKGETFNDDITSAIESLVSELISNLNYKPSDSSSSDSGGDNGED